jgi:nitrate/TMAO reductase-like tetraheme cytochrome c subunit
MLKKAGSYLRKKLLFVIFIGFVLGIIVSIYSNKAIEATSTNESCEMCHVHPHVFDSWKLSVHHDTRVGIHIGCVD